MKTEQQIREKIKEYEDKINELLADNEYTLDEIRVMCIESYLNGRNVLLWVLANEDMLPFEPDDFEENVIYEIACYKSTKIF